MNSDKKITGKKNVLLCIVSVVLLCVLLTFLVTQMLPVSVLLTPIFLMFNNLHLHNTWWPPFWRPVRPPAESTCPLDTMPVFVRK